MRFHLTRLECNLEKVQSRCINSTQYPNPQYLYKKVRHFGIRNKFQSYAASGLKMVRHADGQEIWRSQN